MPRRACSIVLAGVCGLVSAASPAGAAPRIFFADLTSGPHTGGEANAGAFVTLRGHGFGDAQGASRVTIGGGAAASYRLWSDTRVVFQLGPLAQTGPLVIETTAGNSNAAAFTVRAGNLYFVATTGDDGGPGSFALPWRTLVKAKTACSPATSPTRATASARPARTTSARRSRSRPAGFRERPRPSWPTRVRP